MARGKCVGSNENWEYSAQVEVTVTDKILPEVTAVTLSANPTTVEVNKPVTFSSARPATMRPADRCTLNLSYQYSGAGFALDDGLPGATIGQFILTPTAKGTLTVTGHAVVLRESDVS